MIPFSKDNLGEQTVIEFIKNAWADSACYVIAYTDGEDAMLGREHSDKASSLQRRGLGEVL